MSCVVIFFIADMSRMSRSLTKLLTKGILNLFSMTLPSPLSMSTGTMHLNHSKHNNVTIAKDSATSFVKLVQFRSLKFLEKIFYQFFQCS